MVSEEEGSPRRISRSSSKSIPSLLSPAASPDNVLDMGRRDRVTVTVDNAGPSDTNLFPVAGEVIQRIGLENFEVEKYLQEAICRYITSLSDDEHRSAQLEENLK